MRRSLSASEAVVRPRIASTTALDRWLAARLQQSIAASGVGVELWDGTTIHPGGERIGDLLIRDRGALAALLINPDLQYGELYSAGRIDVRGDFAAVVDAVSRVSIDAPLSWRERLALWAARPNALVRARRNIHHHYDLGNDFYQLWLDPQLVYTCAYYPTESAGLEAAQLAKLDLVWRKLRLNAGDTVIEAGCGWGALALHMARAYGARVKAFNISTEQIAFARDRARREGLDDRVTFIEDDYRNVSASARPTCSSTCGHGWRSRRARTSGRRSPIERGDALHLDQCLGVPEPVHADAGHRRVLRAGEPAPDRADLPCVRAVVVHVDDVDGHADEVGRLATGGGQRFQQVAQRLLELPDHPVADDPAVGVEGGLPGQEDQPVR